MIVLPLDQRDNLSLNEGACQDGPCTDTQEQTGTETPERTNGDNAAEVSISLDSDIPVMKRYAHHGKRRRAYTEEMFRCQLTDMISRTPLVCSHLLWKNRPDELRDHLTEHMNVEDVAKLTDSQVLERYTDAKKQFLEGVTDDPDYDEGEDE